jgi:hypothetical protein
MSLSETYQISSLSISEEMPIKLWEVYSDIDLKSEFVDTVQGIMPGAEKYVNCFMAKNIGELKNKVLLHGPAYVSLVCNRRGSLLAQGALAGWYDKDVTATSGTINTFVTAALVVDEEVGNFIVGRNQNIGGQCRQIIKNTTTTITVQPDFNALVVNGTTARIFSSSQVVVGAGSRFANAGIVLSPNGIPDNYWGWVCSWGRVSALIQNGVNISEGVSLQAFIGSLQEYDAIDIDTIIGYSLVSMNNAGIAGADYLAPVFIDCRCGIGYLS